MPRGRRKVGYDVFFNPPREGEKPKFHIRLAGAETIRTHELLIEYLHSQNVLSAEILLDSVISALKEELRRGNKVHIDGLGLFEPQLEADVERREKEYHGSMFDVDNVRVRNITFKAEHKLVKDTQEDVEFFEKHAPHNYTPTDEDVNQMLTWILDKEDSTLMRGDLMRTMSMPEKAATRLLQRLVKEGRLTQHGRKGATFYRPTPGNFGH